ncbi:hypothetical protein ACFUTR_26890, partial [Streptomyces sp. NPDC057367]|uniref:hypothetical protein n=1 Tax=Streptomyces sp. NPDC057367 TaxID=3346108 RepID=UPI00362B5F73
MQVTATPVGTIGPRGTIETDSHRSGLTAFRTVTGRPTRWWNVAARIRGGGTAARTRCEPAAAQVTATPVGTIGPRGTIETDSHRSGLTAFRTVTG